MVCCKDCAHCATMLHFENDYLCTMGGECNWMSGETASEEFDTKDCDFFVTVDDYITEIMRD